MRGKASVFDLLPGIAALLLATSSALAQDVVTYYHADAVGSPIAATDANGNLLWREDYSPYGEKLRQEISPRTNRMWFTGHHHDDDSGLTYAGARHYDPLIGRFMSVDPAGVEPENQFSFNRYAYGNNNPYRYVDPDGREVVLAAGSTRSQRDSYSVTLSYLSRSASFHVMYATLQSSSATYTVNVDENVAHAFARLDENGMNQLYFNPREGLQLQNGAITSAALGFAHEVAHAEHYDRDPEGFLREENKTIVSMEDNAVVYTTVLGYGEVRAVAAENKMAKELGENAGRKSHADGKGTPVPSPTFHRKRTTAASSK